MNTLLVVVAVVAGAGLALQVMINAQLRVVAGSVLWAALIQFGVGMVGIAAVLVAVREPLATASLARAPWWIWSGGLIGGAYIILSLVIVPRLGAALLLASIVVGQLLASMAIDHYGWLGAPVHRFSATRFLGAMLLVGGIALIRWR